MFFRKKTGDATKDPYKNSRLLFIIETALEYFMLISVSTIYLAKITGYMGLSDSVTGVLSAFVSLGVCFQVIAIFINNTRTVKKKVTISYVFAQMLFALVYFIPLLPFSKTLKTVVFSIVLLLAYTVFNSVNSLKMNWCMSLVEDKKRGGFTAVNQTVTLLFGLCISYFLGNVMDYFSGKEKLGWAFIVCGSALLFMGAIHTLVMVFTKEKPPMETTEKEEKRSFLSDLKRLLTNKKFYVITIIPVVWYIVYYMTGSYMATYQSKQLGFSTTTSSVIVMAGSFLSVLTAIPYGKIADRFSFLTMLLVCFTLQIVAYFCAVFVTPNTSWLYAVYYLLSSAGLSGISMSYINLVCDYIEEDKRVSAYALQQAIAGAFGFLTTLLASPFVSKVQKKGNVVFGFTIYPQQILCAFGFVLLVGLVVFVLVIKKKMKKE